MEPPIHEAEDLTILKLEQRQEDILHQLDELDASILALVEEFNQRLAQARIEATPSNAACDLDGGT